MNRKLSLVLMIVLGLTLSACGTNTRKDGGTLPDNGGGSVGDANQPVHGTKYTAQQLEELFGIVGSPLNYKTVYFEYNSSTIDERSRIIASAHARNVSGGTRVSLEGHADERGTRDYNLALGDRRAQAVADLMTAINSGATLQTISYGEERPVNTDHNEAAWQQNRRVEISY